MFQQDQNDPAFLLLVFLALSPGLLCQHEVLGRQLALHAGRCGLGSLRVELSSLVRVLPLGLTIQPDLSLSGQQDVRRVVHTPVLKTRMRSVEYTYNKLFCKRVL